MALVSASHKHQAGSLSSTILLITHQGAIRSSLSQSLESNPQVLHRTPGSSPCQWPASSCSGCGRGRKGTLPHTARQAGKQVHGSYCSRLLCYLFSLAVGYADEEQGLQVPGSPPWFRKVSFSGNPFCKFPSTDDLRAALSELSNVGYRRRWCVWSSHPISPKPVTSLLLVACKAGWYTPSLLSVSWLHRTSPCFQFPSPSPFFPSAWFSTLFSLQVEFTYSHVQLVD